MAIKFEQRKAGDLLKVTGRHEINGKLALPVGSQVVITKVLKFGVEVEDAAGKKHTFGYEHGAEKLELLKEGLKPSDPCAETEANDELQAQNTGAGQQNGPPVLNPPNGNGNGKAK